MKDLRRFLQSTGGGIRDRSASSLPDLEVSVGEDIDRGWDDVGVNNRLNEDVRNGPVRLLDLLVE